MRYAALQALTPADLDDWASLARHAVEPNPFFEPGFVAAVARSSRAVEPQIMVLEDGGEWIGCAPVAVARGLALSTWRHPYSYVGTPLVLADRVDDFAAALVAERGNRRLDRRFLLLWEAVDGSVTAAVRRAAARAGRTEVLFERVSERAALARRAEPGSHLAHLKRKRRREIERKRERLAAELGADPALVDRTGDPDAVDRFLRLEAEGWKGNEGSAMATAGDSDVFRSICAGFSAAGQLEILTLEAGDAVLAMQCNISGGDTLFSFKIAHDERYRSFGPGLQLEVDSMRFFQERRTERLVDTCGDPANQFLNRLWPDRQRTTIMVIGPGGLVGKAARGGLDAAYGYRTRRREG